MWLRSEKRSSRIAQPTNKPSISLRKIIKNPAALKNLKQTATVVTPNRRYSVCAAAAAVAVTTQPAAATQAKTRKNGSAKQLPTNKCNIKSQTVGVKRLIRKSKTSTGKRHDTKKFSSVAKATAAAAAAGGDLHHKRVRLPRNSLRTISDVGKENRWQHEVQLSACLVDKRRGGRMRTTGTTEEHHESTDPVDVVQLNLPRVDTCSVFALASDSCDSCKPSTACSCSSSSSNQTDDPARSNGGLGVPKTDCLNAIFVECDSTTDNDRTSAPSTSMLLNPVRISPPTTAHISLFISFVNLLHFIIK